MSYDVRDQFWVKEIVEKLRFADADLAIMAYEKLCGKFGLQYDDEVWGYAEALGEFAEEILLSDESPEWWKEHRTATYEQPLEILEWMEDRGFVDFYVFNSWMEEKYWADKEYVKRGFGDILPITEICSLVYYFKQFYGIGDDESIFKSVNEVAKVEDMCETYKSWEELEDADVDDSTDEDCDGLSDLYAEKAAYMSLYR